MQQTEPKGSEVRAKVVAATKWDASGAGFDVHFRNGGVWHLAAEDAVSIAVIHPRVEVFLFEEFKC